MKILICSDLHLEFGQHLIPKVENEKDTVVVLAGDIGLAKRKASYESFIENTCDRFKNVIWIMGNHEAYGTNLPTVLAKIWNATLDHENLYVVDNETVTIGDVAFVCSTLWTNFDNNNIMTMHEAELWMNDYKLIRTGPSSEPWRRKLKPLDTVSLHLRAKEYIFPEITKQKESGKTVVVVTHHLPSFLSVPEMFKGDSMNGAYASELFEDIMDTQPSVWIHGHTHFSFDYTIGDTRVICNPRGYCATANNRGELNPDFNPEFTIEV